MLNKTKNYSQNIKNYNVKELQEAIFVGGELVYQDPTVVEKQRYCEEQMATLYPEVKRTENPHLYYIDLSRKLLQLKKELIKQAKEQCAQNDIAYTFTKKI